MCSLKICCRTDILLAFDEGGMNSVAAIAMLRMTFHCGITMGFTCAATCRQSFNLDPLSHLLYTSLHFTLLSASLCKVISRTFGMKDCEDVHRMCIVHRCLRFT